LTLLPVDSLASGATAAVLNPTDLVRSTGPPRHIRFCNLRN
jgi:hypothetical protein